MKFSTYIALPFFLIAIGFFILSFLFFMLENKSHSKNKKDKQEEKENETEVKEVNHIEKRIQEVLGKSKSRLQNGDIGNTDFIEESLVAATKNPPVSAETSTITPSVDDRTPAEPIHKEKPVKTKSVIITEDQTRQAEEEAAVLGNNSEVGIIPPMVSDDQTFDVQVLSVEDEVPVNTVDETLVQVLSATEEKIKPANIITTHVNW